MKDLAGKVAVVTGGASGIGAATARRFAEEGMSIVLADIDESAMATVTETIGADTGVDVLAVRTDVSKADQVEALADDALERFGAVHVVFNNAGVGICESLWNTSIADWEFLLGVNVWGVIHGIRTFVPIMRKQNQPAHLINTASLAGLGTVPTLGAYCATKHAVIGMTEALHAELALLESPVKVSVLCPSFTKTPLFRNSQRLRPGEVLDLEGPLAHFDEFMNQGIDGGVDPRELADMVVDGIRNDRFWIVAVTPNFQEVYTRVAQILEGRNPTVPKLPPLGGAPPPASE